ncbi:MAG: DNA mismatch repair endonuclease MutL, partial [Muribaculaceae bacterium]|nr:DNA mismatch repair endonuclease MutL [Muribaculaceae bacterium]
KIVIRASKVESQQPVATVKGTNIMVKNLFYNFVARRRFLKKDSVELSHIVQEFERLALVNPGIALKLSHNGSVLHQLQRSSLRERIGALFGKNLEKNLIPVEADTSLVAIKGFIALPSAAKTRGAKQYFFVNGRNMRHPYFHKAVVSCFENLIAKDAQPQYFLSFDVPPEKIDVNIHPKKHEIKFEEEQSIWQILTASIRNSLGRYNVGTTIDFDNIGQPDIPPLVEGAPRVDSPVDNTADPNYTPFAAHDFDMRVWEERPPEQKLDFGQAVSRPSSLNTGIGRHRESGGRINIPSNWDSLYDAFTDEKKKESLSVADEPRRSFWQLRNRYILTETSGGLMIIDQHRAHVSILFHSMMSDKAGGQLATQNLLFELPLDLEPAQKIVLDSSIELIEKLGFRINTAGSQYMLTAVPTVLDRTDPVDMLRTIISDLMETGTDIEEDVVSRLALTLARGAAIKSGQVLTPAEQEHIVSSLFKLESPRYTPDGSLVIADLDDDALSRLF